ncbi:MAG: hypothetical protein M1138_07055 [Candidatus Thermoplasmatota archaeon]|jgi:hypothetical protein|nr:hypothetical protein [Candidatus Thermoplasmatota archaeon]
MVRSRDFDLWNQVLASAVMGNRVLIGKEDLNGNSVTRPESSGLLVRSVGSLSGQKADWRSPIDGSRKGIHVVEYADRYEVHTDRFDPSKRPLEHLVFDYGPVLLKGALIAIAAQFLASRSRSRRY